MYFRNGRQRAGACRTLLALEGLTDLWSDTGPRLEAQLERRCDLGTPDAEILLLTCWALWDDTGIAAVADLLRLKAQNLLAVGELLHAMAHGPKAVDAWIEAWSEHSEPARSLGPQPAAARPDRNLDTQTLNALRKGFAAR